MGCDWQFGDIDLAFLGFFALGCDCIVLESEGCTWREVGGDPVVC